jgi:hypothetical protein
VHAFARLSNLLQILLSVVDPIVLSWIFLSIARQPFDGKKICNHIREIPLNVTELKVVNSVVFWFVRELEIEAYHNLERRRMSEIR